MIINILDEDLVLKYSFITESFEILKIALNRPREELYKRINDRVEKMLNLGLIEEVKQVIEYKEHMALKTVGYKESFDYLEGSISITELKELIQRNTRRYAKRQLTWFNNQDTFNWFHPEDEHKVHKFIEESLRTFETN